MHPRLAPALSTRFTNIAIGGGGYVSGIEYSPLVPRLCYLRTDVGGAYRRDRPDQPWTALLDDLGPGDWNLHGVDSILADRHDPDRVYAACGTYQNPMTGNAAILRSADQGRSWQRCDLPFKLGGNEAGRGSGERLAQSPVNPEHLLFGSRANGLWQSLDRGASWKQVPSLGIPPDGSAGQIHDPKRGKWNWLGQKVGIIQVLFLPQADSKPPAWLVAVSRHRDGLLCSLDQGHSWQTLPHQPQGLRPVCLAPDGLGRIYITYNQNPGPNSMAPGALWALDLPGAVADPSRIQATSWQDLTPALARDSAACGGQHQASPDGSGHLPWGVAAVAPLPGRTDHVVCSSHYRAPGEELFLSTDRGQHWRPLLAGSDWDHLGVSYATRHRVHWMTDLACAPLDHTRPEAGPAGPVSLMFTTGYGVFHCPDLLADRPLWRFENQGLEETVPLCLHSPATGADQVRLLSGLGDIDGFIHRDFAAYPQAAFDQPGYKNTEFLCAAGLVPTLLARSGTTYGHDKVHGATSSDGGKHWQALASAPPLEPPPAKAAQHPRRSPPVPEAGTMAWEARGRMLLWAPRGSRPWRSADQGATWLPCGNLDFPAQVLADPSLEHTFYAWETKTGRFWRSQDDGAKFQLMNRGFRAWQLRASPSPWGHLSRSEIQSLPGIPGGLMLLARQRLLFSLDGGRRWQVLARGLLVRHFGLGAPLGGAGSVKPGAFPAIYIQGKLHGHSGLFVSTDGGQVWQPLEGPGSGFATLGQLEGDPCIPGAFYLGTGGRGIFAARILEWDHDPEIQ